jgi:hypothetical protein
MRVFLDTEFTDFANPRLISCGLVAENGHEFYAELSDGWLPEQCSAFVQDVVLPRLDQSRVTTLSRRDAGIQIFAWLSALSNKLTLIHDVDVDWQLLAGLLRSVPNQEICIDARLLSWPGAAMARHYELLLAKTLPDDPMRHHALVDARALCRAVLQTEMDFRR